MFRLISLMLRIFSRDGKATIKHESTICFTVNDATCSSILTMIMWQSYINIFLHFLWTRDRRTTV